MSTIIPSLGGYVCIRNGLSLGYSAVEAVESLLKVCSEVVVADAQSTDGTLELFQRMAEREPRIKLVSFPWTNPKGVGCEYWVDWLNFARQHLTTRHQITLDGDECLDSSPECHAAIREACESDNPARRFHRLNYWKDPFHLIPIGHCCSPSVARMGFTEMRMPTDQPTKPGEFPINDAATKDDRLVIHHLGFLRKPKFFYAKSKAVQSIWVNGYDTRLTQTEAEGKPQWEIENCEWTKSLTPYNGHIPDAVQRWMSSQGHHTPDYLAEIELPPDPVVKVTEVREEKEPFHVLHYGDFGDMIHGLAILKHQGPVNLYLDDRNSICKRIIERIHIIAPLLLSQGYINLVKRHEGEPIHWNAGEFRANHRTDTSLAFAHLMHYLGQKHLPRIFPDLTKPWIEEIPQDPRARGRVLVNKTNRYPNPYFRWKEVMNHFRDVAFFVGLADEHRRFEDQFGPIEYIPTADMLEVAKLVAGSDLVIANQSSVLAVAEAMKHPRLVEVCNYQPDVIVAHTPEQYLSGDGAVNIQSFAGKPPLQLSTGLAAINYLVNTSTIPRGGWKFEDLTGGFYEDLEAKVMRKKTVDKKEAKKLILDDLYGRFPEYFGPIQAGGILALYETAKRNAQKP